jgi:hypothetical protein
MRLPFAAEQKARLQRLAEMPDDQIDFSDAPEVADFSGFMTVEEAKAFRAARKAQTAAVFPTISH